MQQNCVVALQRNGYPPQWKRMWSSLSSILAVSYINVSANSAGAAAELAASRKSAEYADLPASCIFSADSA